MQISGNMPAFAARTTMYYPDERVGPVKGIVICPLDQVCCIFAAKATLHTARAWLDFRWATVIGIIIILALTVL